MNTLYKRTFLLLFICLTSFISFSQKQAPTFSLTAANTKLSIEWMPGSTKPVMIIAKENGTPAAPIDGGTYLDNTEFGAGTACGGGFVVFKGTANNVNISGLRSGSNYYFEIYEYNASGKFTNVSQKLFSPERSPLDGSAKIENTMAAVICPALAGVTCTLNGTSSSTYLGAPAGCNAGAFAGSNPWDGGSAAGWVSWTFSAPLNKVTLKSGSVNTNDSGTNVLTGGVAGATSVTGLVCLSSVAGMVISFFTGACCGDVAWTVNTTGSFSVVTLNNTGGQSGWIAECPTSLTSVLPIELMNFTAKCNSSDQVNLNWKTMTETNNAYFTIERSKGAEVWEELTKIPGAGNSNKEINYSFTDRDPIRGLSYYRLKQTDLNSEFKYSPAIAMDNCNTKYEVSIFPNPASKEITITAEQDGTTLEIYNVLGSKIGSEKLIIGDNKINVSEFNSGTYFFKVLSEGNIIRTNKVLIHN